MRHGKTRLVTHHKGFKRLVAIIPLLSESYCTHIVYYSLVRLDTKAWLTRILLSYSHSHHPLKLFLKRHIQHANVQFSKIFPFFLEVPAFTKKSPSQVSVSPGSDLELCCAATGSPPPTVEWSRGQRSIDATLYQNGCLTLKNVKDENTGKYICRATNSVGFT